MKTRQTSARFSHRLNRSRGHLVLYSEGRARDDHSSPTADGKYPGRPTIGNEGQRETALQALHDRHAPELWRFALRLTHDRELAQDVVQEVLLRAWRDPGLLDRDEAVARAWLFTVARHLIVDKWRSASFRHEVRGELLHNEGASDSSGEVLDRWLIADALRHLSVEHRAVIWAAYYEGRSVADIAGRTGVPEGTVKSRLHYGLRTLRLILQEKGVTQP